MYICKVTYFTQKKTKKQNAILKYRGFAHQRRVRTTSDVNTHNLVLLLLELYRHFFTDWYTASLRIQLLFRFLGFFC